MERALLALEAERLARIDLTKATFVKRRSLIEQDVESSRILRMPRSPHPALSAARRGAAKRSARKSCEAAAQAAPGGDKESTRYGWGGGGDGESTTPARAAPARAELNGRGGSFAEIRRAFDESPRRESDPGPRSGGPSYLADDTEVLWVTPSSPHERLKPRPRTTPLRKAFSFSGPVTDAPATHGGERKGRGFERSSSWHDGNSAPPSRLLFGSERAEEGRFSLAKPTRCVPALLTDAIAQKHPRTLLRAHHAHEHMRARDTCLRQDAR